MKTKYLDMHERLLEDKKLKSSMQKMNFEFTKLNLRGSLTGIAKENREELTSFSRDGAGGVFCFNNDDHRITYLTSEGAGGYIALNFEEFVLVVCSFPYVFQDLITVGISQDAMREMSASVTLELREDMGDEVYNKIMSVSQYMKEKANLSTDMDPILALYLGLHIDPPYRFFSSDGEEFDQLFEHA